MGEFGIKETDEMLKFAIGMANGLSDGFQLSDIGLLMDAPAAIAGAGQIPKELGDMDAAEKEQLMETVRQFDIPEDKVEEVVEQALSAGIELSKLSVLLVNLKSE